ncbi:hypothetical protein N836_27920 [Leptolyngbya sp. Heron Island J]|uniref:hypothetical protein n=1 Tax=Leptolyngbya sp. Heron Island J TaxID=1385935 RepID=UPI0003B94AF3|nr:hypothetical protein [Leptolyngbya sp. Heron Island J]ESA31984.1 hypothetical protein N836_27920 [Leptolyngbya sp. Heron Island J]
MVNINPGQIVYLECLDQRLYVEAIQLAGSARLWCRPLMLVGHLPHGSRQQQLMIAKAAADLEACSLELYDLKTAPDLVWPIDRFKLALDTDFFALLFHLRIADDTGPEELAKQRFQYFLHTCWNTGNFDDDTPHSSTKLVSIR